MTASMGQSMGSGGPAGHGGGGFSAVASLEEQLVVTLREALREIDHTDCLDNEERSEIYTILQALSADTEQHRDIVGQWVSDRKPEAGHV